MDRDGVINQSIIVNGKPFPPKNFAEFELYPDTKKALSALKQEGYFLVVVTNQPDVGRGTLKRESVEEIHNNMQELLPIDDIRVCYDDGRLVDTEFRKPNPGMLLSASKEFELDLSRSFMIGDRWKDIDAGKKAGCKTIFINRNYDETLNEIPDFTVSSLWNAAEIILLNKSK